MVPGVDRRPGRGCPVSVNAAAERVLQVARGDIGTVESPPGSNRTIFGARYGLNGVAWCNIWVWDVMQRAGAGNLICKSAYTPSTWQWFKQRGQIVATPRPGDVVFFDFPGDGVDRISHVGLVEAVHADGTVTTIEGNTTPGTAGSQRDGGGVWRRRRRTGVVAFARPAYAAAAPPAVPPTLSEDLVQCFDWPAGPTAHKIVCPVGRASQVTRRAWFSMACDGEITDFGLWFQADQGGLAEYHGRVEQGRRAWWELPDGCTQIVVHVDATGPVGAALELLPKT